MLSCTNTVSMSVALSSLPCDPSLGLAASRLTRLLPPAALLPPWLPLPPLPWECMPASWRRLAKLVGPPLPPWLSPPPGWPCTP